MRRVEATRAYQAAARTRGVREQEADVFLSVNARLRRATSAAASGEATPELPRALADNERLWTAVVDQLRDPANALPLALRGSIISVGLAVHREVAREAPDVAFLIGVNEQLAAGLMGQ